MEFGFVPVKKLVCNIGMDQNGRIMSQVHQPAPHKVISVIPGRYAKVEIMDPATGKPRTVAEFPLPPLGWEYEPAPLA
jgi:hypothetical protein